MIIPFVTFLLLVGIILIFARVRTDYLKLGRLSPPTAFLLVLLFALHAASSYFFLDSHLSHIRRGPVFDAAIVCLAAGLILTWEAMVRLGWRQSLGTRLSVLRESGPYRLSRNPQIVGYALVVIGYALLWPAWLGLVWVVIYLVIAHWMVSAEEEHLRRQFGKAYVAYCQRTPRYIGLPKPLPRPQKQKRRSKARGL